MGVPTRRIAPGRERLTRELGWPVALGIFSLLVGAFVQNAERYGWLAGVVAGMIALRTMPVQAAPPSPDRRPIGWVLAAGGHIAALAWITYVVVQRVDPSRGAASAGNEALLIAAAWGGYGLLAHLTGRYVQSLPWKGIGQVILAAAMLYMLVGGVLANGRWADWSVRLTAYVAVLGSPWLATWVEAKRGAQDEADRYLALAATALGFTLIGFEVVRWLETPFTYAMGTFVSHERLREQQNLLNGISVACWTLYGIAVLRAGALLHSRSVRLLGSGLLFATLLFGIMWGVSQIWT